MAFADIIAHIKKKKVASSQCPATTAVKTSVSSQVHSKMHFLFKFFLKIIFWDYYL